MKRWMLVVLLLILAIPQHYRSDIHTANESARIYTAQAIVHHGTVSMNPVFVDYQPDWKPAHGPLNVDVSQRDGEYLLDKAPGITMLAIPIVAVHALLSGGKSDYASLAWLLTFLLCVLPCVLFARFMNRWLGKEEKWSTLVPIALLVATPWFAYSGLLFGHALAAVFVGVGAILSLGPLKEEDTDCCTKSPLYGGLFWGAAVLTEYTTAILVILGCSTLLFSAKGRGRLLRVIAGGSVAAALLICWNWLAFGGPLSFSYSFKDHPDHAEIIAQGAFGFTWPDMSRLVGILFSAKRGLLFIAPWLLTSIIGAIAATRDRSLSQSWRIYIPMTVFLVPVIISGFVDWEAGDSMGPRHLVSALPIWGIASVLALRKLQGSVWTSIIAGLIGVSFLMCFVGAYIYPYFPGSDPSGFKATVANPVFELSVPLWLMGNTGKTILADILPSGLTFTLMLLLGALLLSKAGGFLNRRAPVSPARIGLSTVTGLFFLFLALGPMSSGAKGLQDVHRAQAFAHEQLGRTDLATQIYESMCSKANGEACFAAATIWRDGHGVTVDPAKARSLFREGCESKNWRSCRELGKCFMWGIGGAQDPARAQIYFEQARSLRPKN